LCVVVEEQGRNLISSKDTQSAIWEVSMSTAVSTIPGDKTICLPIADGVDYNQLVKDCQGFRQYLDQLIAQNPRVSARKMSL